MDHNDQHLQTRPEDIPATRDPQSVDSTAAPQQQQQQQSPQAALAAVTRGDNVAPPQPPPKLVTYPNRRATTSTGEGDTVSGHGSSPPREPYRQGGPPPPRPISLKDGGPHPPSGENVIPHSRRRRSGLDWIVPIDGSENKPYIPRPRTAGERLQPTLDQARREKLKFERKAMLNGYSLNAAIGLQVVLGALVTGLSAAIKPEKVGITTAILGGFSTIVASFLARMRGSGEPDLSQTRVKDLDQFIRECDAFQMDRGHITGHEEDQTLEDLRKRFEGLLGNTTDQTKQPPA